MIYENETLNFEEVVSKIVFEERRMKGDDNTSSNSVLVARGMSYVKKQLNECEMLKYWTSNINVPMRQRQRRALSQILAMSHLLWEIMIFSEN